MSVDWCAPIHRQSSFAECETCIEGQMCQGCILKAVIGGLLIDWHCIERLVMPGWIGPGLASECWIGDVLV